MSRTVVHPAYLLAAEADEIVAASLPATSPERSAYDALDAAGKARVLGEATAEIDACAWNGVRADSDQTFAFPRIDGTSGCAIDADPNEVTGDWSVPGVPRDVRLGCALLAAAIAAREAGTDGLAHVHTAAAAGVTGTSSRSHSQSWSPMAASPWARLTPRVQRLLRPLRRLGGTIV